MKKKQVKTEEPRRPSLDDTIKALLKEGPLAGLYFSVAIDAFKEHISKMSDEELAKMFERLIHPQDVRDNVEEMCDRINKRKVE